MGRRLRCSSVTDRFRYAPSFPPVRLGPPCRRPILNATTSPLYARRYTSNDSPERPKRICRGGSFSSLEPKLVNMDWIYSGPFRATSFLPALVAFPASWHGFWGYFCRLSVFMATTQWWRGRLGDEHRKPGFGRRSLGPFRRTVGPVACKIGQKEALTDPARIRFQFRRVEQIDGSSARGSCGGGWMDGFGMGEGSPVAWMECGGHGFAIKPSAVSGSENHWCKRFDVHGGICERHCAYHRSAAGG